MLVPGAPGKRIQWSVAGKRTWFETKIGNGPASAKKPMWLTDLTIASTCVKPSALLDLRTHDIPYGFPFKGSPNYSFVSNCKLCQSAPWKYFSFRDLEGVQYGYDIIAPGASALYVLHQLSGDQLVHIPAEIWRVQGDLALKAVEEEHFARYCVLRACSRSSLSTTFLVELVTLIHASGKKSYLKS